MRNDRFRIRLKRLRRLISNYFLVKYYVFFFIFTKNLSGDMGSQLRWIHQLLTAEQQFVLCLQFGISRYLLPLAERKDVLKAKEHSALFQNVQEV